MEAAISFCLSISPSKFFKSSIYVVHKLGFSLITFNLFFMGLGKCNYICMQVCIYVVMFILLTSHNLLYGYINDKAIQLHQKEPFWTYGKFGSSLPQNYSTLCFMICCKDFFQHDGAQQVGKGNFTLSHFFPKILLWCKWEIQVFTKQCSGVGGNSSK